jgi:hypothetical protein
MFCDTWVYSEMDEGRDEKMMERKEGPTKLGSE